MRTGATRLAMALAAAAVLLAPTTASAQSYAQDISGEASWLIANTQATCSGAAKGAIAQAPWSYSGTGSQIVDPYRANYAALGLLAAGSAASGTTRTADYAAVKAWVLWYFGHLNWPDVYGQYGTVYYYSDTPTTCAETLLKNSSGEPYYDAEDSWGATFLSVLGAWWNVDPTDAKALLTQTSPTDYPYLIDSIANASIANLSATTGLTGADPWYTAQYTMDNAEVVEGLDAYAWLAGSKYLNEPTKATYWSGVASNIKTAMGSHLWGQCGSSFFCVAAGDPAHTLVSCSPASTGNANYEYFWDLGLGGEAQGWPSFAGLGTTAAHSSTVYGELNSECPQWATSAWLPTPSQAEPDAPDSGLGLGAALTGDAKDAGNWLTAAEKNWVSTGRKWPWTVQESGTLIRIAAVLNGAKDVVP